MALQSDKYRTQWACQFFVAAELTRRGYLVAFTLGNAPTVDLFATSPKGVTLRIDVKGQASRNFWLIRDIPAQDDLFYMLVYLPNGGAPPCYFIMTSGEVQAERASYRRHIEESGGLYRDELGGFNWTRALCYEGQWGKLP